MIERGYSRLLNDLIFFSPFSILSFKASRTNLGVLKQARICGDRVTLYIRDQLQLAGIGISHELLKDPASLMRSVRHLLL